MDKEKKVDPSTTVLLLLFVVVNTFLRYTDHIESKTLILILFSSVYFTRSIPDFDYKNIKTYLFPIVMLILYIATVLMN